MIGVAVTAADRAAAAEFFELFKTPWELVVPGRKYSVVVTTGDTVEDADSDLLFIYSSSEHPLDRAAGVTVADAHGTLDIDWNGWSLPVYGGLATFDADADASAPRFGERPVSYSGEVGGRRIRRIGYDLFAEVRRLLTDGQPVSRALSPTLELHVEMMRRALVDSGVSFVEVAPRPLGYDFICCLTHDVDFFGVRRHKFDRTLAGFVFRASIGSLLDVFRGRRVVADAFRNWVALLSLPFVFLGLVQDFWHPFDDYARIEKGRRSTYFLVPFKGVPGVAPGGSVEESRAVPYDISDIGDELGRAAAHTEFAVHGIEAWRDADAGQAEMRRLTARTGSDRAGVRMHWLYFDRESPRRLEAAGFDYDSTCGYNDAVGFRAGTSQVFRLPNTEDLMELPLSIMDTALFFPRRMNLDPEDAAEQCRHIIAAARRFGGTVVINWHDRSLAPERLLGRFYRQLLQEVSAGDRAWFAAAGEAVDWFRWRRSIRFVESSDGRTVSVLAGGPSSQVPAGVVYAHRAAGRGKPTAQPFDGRGALEVSL